jgi:hypothetical protein
MKVESTFIVNFALTAGGERKIQLKGGFTVQHLALAGAVVRESDLAHARDFRNPGEIALDRAR